MKANVTACEVGASGADFFSVSLMFQAFVSRVVVWTFSQTEVTSQVRCLGSIRLFRLFTGQRVGNDFEDCRSRLLAVIHATTAPRESSFLVAFIVFSRLPDFTLQRPGVNLNPAYKRHNQVLAAARPHRTLARMPSMSNTVGSRETFISVCCAWRWS